jgi:glucosamine-6-phosphate deaminase
MDYYSYELEDFKRDKPDWEFLHFSSRDEQNAFFAADLVKRLRANERENRKTVIVLPVGPIEYRPLVELSNSEGISLENLVVFFMDEYCEPDGTYIDRSHPLSFRRFVEENLYGVLREENRMPEENIIFPNAKDPSETISRIEEFGGIEVTYGGFGITGHLAFNDPPESAKERTEENVRYSTVRMVNLSRETLVQNAMGGTGGNVDLIPRHAVTLGMKEMLSASEIHLYLLRTWHAGIMRKALFGPITPECPGSYVQHHEKVRVCMTPEALALPAVNVTLNIGA